MLRLHKSKLQLEKEAAAAAAQEQPVVRSPARQAYDGPALEDTLGQPIIRKSRLQLEKEAAAAAAAAAGQQEAAQQAGRRAAAASGGPGLGECLRPHKSRLQLAKEEAAAAATAATLNIRAGALAARHVCCAIHSPSPAAVAPLPSSLLSGWGVRHANAWAVGCGM